MGTMSKGVKKIMEVSEKEGKKVRWRLKSLEKLQAPPQWRLVADFD
jgi:hypothetical protein